MKHCTTCGHDFNDPPGICSTIGCCERCTAENSATATDARILRDIRARIDELNQALDIAADAGIFLPLQLHAVKPGNGLDKPATLHVCMQAPRRVVPIDDGVSPQGGTA